MLLYWSYNKVIDSNVISLLSKDIFKENFGHLNDFLANNSIKKFTQKKKINGKF